MFTSITSAIGAIKGMTELLKSANDLKGTSEINTVKIEMQRLIIELQNSLMQAQLDGQKIIDELNECKEKLNKLEEFQLQSEKYKQTKLETGSIVYRDEVNDIDLCAHCFLNHKISLLQPCKSTLAFIMMECPNCSNRIQYKKNTIPDPNLGKGFVF